MPQAGRHARCRAVGTYGTDYHDVTTGPNGNCGSVCNAAGGYDHVTGLGSPIAPALVQALVARP
ncbi:peptidase S8 and S53, subtilisin, kexin, sedolisin [Burkholderia ambifaria MEX-5]|uniref:Peptidase S8 and S53, subtilisin, kexin, sedolisin n=1 Tax=Burkholderia ambifaria MEX-5 TaxID=396597 RepID=B1T4W7_9BURK|nr:peptidase S8 and S53, subtilisin, kexin, sedolisin [Burkholderia ambifaria MEX-5]